ncbi:MAG: serine hydrolase domain-containing protein [Novosphingobium sp.]
MAEPMILTRRGLLAGGAALAGAGLLPRWTLAAPTTAAPPASIDRQWPKVAAMLDGYVSSRKLAGAQAAFGWGAGPMSTVSRGVLGFENPVPLTPDSLYRVYSMTKPVTGMAAMILIDEGKLGLDQKLADFMPEFADPKVAIDPAKSLDARPAASQITIRQLMTHTSGLGYSIGGNKVAQELLRLGVVPAVVSRLPVPGLTAPIPTPDPDEFVRRAATVPLVAEPGTAWSYSMGLDVLGLVIGRVAGKPFGAFLQERLFGPAGMASSFFQVPAEAAPRLTTNYGFVSGVAVPIDKPADSVYRDPPAFAFGGAGLVCSPADYDRFLQLLVGGGRIGGTQVIPERAVRLGMSNLLPPGVRTKGTMADGAGFGAGGKVGLGAEEGYFGWAGAAGTVAFVNARQGLRAGLYVQYMPDATYPLRDEFLTAVRGDLLARPPEIAEP